MNSKLDEQYLICQPKSALAGTPVHNSGSQLPRTTQQAFGGCIEQTMGAALRTELRSQRCIVDFRKTLVSAQFGIDAGRNDFLEMRPKSPSLATCSTKCYI